MFWAGIARPKHPTPHFVEMIHSIIILAKPKRHNGQVSDFWGVIHHVNFGWLIFPSLAENYFVAALAAMLYDEIAVAKL